MAQLVRRWIIRGMRHVRNLLGSLILGNKLCCERHSWDREKEIGYNPDPLGEAGPPIPMSKIEMT